jgi:SAM-dependent methyltransferase
MKLLLERTLLTSQRQLLAPLPPVEERLYGEHGWSGQYGTLRASAYLRSALRSKGDYRPLSLRQFRDGELDRISSGATLVKRFMCQLQPTHLGRPVLDFPCANGRYAAYPGLLAIEATRLGYKYRGVDGVPQAVAMARQRTARMLHKYGCNTTGTVDFFSADHNKVLDFFADEELALTFTLELFLHMNRDEVEHYLSRLKEKTAPGGIILFSLTPSEDNIQSEFDSTRTRLHSQKIIKIMNDWQRVFIPKNLSRVLFFAEAIAQNGLKVRPECVRNYAFRKPYN